MSLVMFGSNKQLVLYCLFVESSMGFDLDFVDYFMKIMNLCFARVVDTINAKHAFGDDYQPIGPEYR